MTIPIPLQEALRDSITSGTFVDTKFWVFSSRRSNSGRVGAPKPLFVNERVARRVPRLGALLDKCKSNQNLRTRFPANAKPYTTKYDYEDDSDLGEDDEDDEEDVPDDELAVTPRVETEKSGSDSPDLFTIENSDAKSSKSSDTLSVSDLNPAFSAPSDARDETKSAHVGKVAVIQDTAFITFQALLRYLYTNEIEFAPWGSSERRDLRALETISESYGIPKPSPKSIYRLADKYDIPELKQLALSRIQQGLSKCHIVEELFSKFTSWYPDLRELEIKQLARTLLSSNHRPTLESLGNKLDCYTKGRLPYGGHIFSALYKLMEGDMTVEEEPLPELDSPNAGIVGGDWDGLKKALTISLTSGTFLDSQFYAVESRTSAGPPKIRPVYFSSIVGGDFMSKIIACSSKLKAWKASFQFANGYDSDVEDGEPDQGQSMDHYPRWKCIRECPTPMDLVLDPPLLLNCGAAKTWGAMFLYVYTGQTAFSAIGSQDPTSEEPQNGPSEDETKRRQDPGGLGGPPPVGPCSPKSIYHLAKKVGLTGLCDVAFKDIRSKLNEKNIIGELFSPFTADHAKIREMEYDLFRSKLKPLVDDALIPHFIESSSSGDHPHRMATVGLIIAGSVQGRRKRMASKAKNNTARPDSTSPPRGDNETSRGPIQQVPPPAPEPQPQYQPSGFVARYLIRGVTKQEAPPCPPAVAEPAKKAVAAQREEPAKKPVAVQREEPPIDGKVNQPPSEIFVELVCMNCGIKQRRKRLKAGIYCNSCPRSSSVMRCVGCGTDRAENVKTCTNCHKGFQ